MVPTATKPLILNDFLQLPETEPASEYIDGLIIQKSMSQGEHSVLQTELAPAINSVLKPRQNESNQKYFTLPQAWDSDGMAD